MELKILKDLQTFFRRNKKLQIKSNIHNNSLMDYVSNIIPDDIIIDCGANVGKVIKHVSNLGCEIIAFEPNPYAFNVLKENFNTYKNVKCINKAVSTYDGKSKLFYHENSKKDNLYWSTGSSLHKNKNNINKTNYIIVETVDIARFILSLKKNIKIVKIDIEGEEINVINHIIDYDLHKVISAIIVETHEQKIHGHRAQLDKLRKRIREMNIYNIYLDWN